MVTEDILLHWGLYSFNTYDGKYVYEQLSRNFKISMENTYTTVGVHLFITFITLYHLLQLLQLFIL